MQVFLKDAWIKCTTDEIKPYDFCWLIVWDCSLQKWGLSKVRTTVFLVPKTKEKTEETKSTVCAKKTQHGRCCLFPFQYHGKLYNSCTTVGYGNTLWCGTTKYVTYARSTWDECPKGKQHFLKVQNSRNHHYYNILFFILQFNKDLVIEKLR